MVLPSSDPCLLARNILQASVKGGQWLGMCEAKKHTILHYVNRVVAACFMALPCGSFTLCALKQGMPGMPVKSGKAQPAAIRWTEL